MLRRLFSLLPALAFCLAAAPTLAQDVVADLSQNRVSITANFDGSEILVFGAIKHEAVETEPLNVIVTVTGPIHPIVVRRKEKVSGIWVNLDVVEVEEAPTFYAVATTGPFNEALSEEEDARAHISVERAVGHIVAPSHISDPESFAEAMIRIRTGSGLYSLNEGGVSLSDNTLFRTNIALPSNLVEGDYVTRILLTRDGRIINSFDTEIAVRKVGLERWLYSLAREKSLIYGLLSLFIAIAAGWMASAFFRYIRF